MKCRRCNREFVPQGYFQNLCNDCIDLASKEERLRREERLYSLRREERLYDEVEQLRAAAKRVLEADMRGVRDLDALNALEDAAGFTQQGQRRKRNNG